jgi:hypothetical protein
MNGIVSCGDFRVFDSVFPLVLLVGEAGGRDTPGLAYRQRISRADAP